MNKDRKARQKLEKGLMRRLFAMLLSVCVLVSSVNFPTTAAEEGSTTSANYTTVADPGTAYTYEDMMGTDADGNRYAGRVWVDKSVYAHGDTMKLSSTNSHTVNLVDEEEFLVAFSALGSSTVVSTEKFSSGSLDVVLVMDISASMGRYVDNSKTTRLDTVTEAANELINNILESSSNRVAVVTYGVGSGTLLDLAHHEAVTGTDILTVSQSNKPNADNSGGVQVEIGDAKITATTTDGSTTQNAYYRGTNLQAGIDEGMAILADEENVTGRTPIVIVLTDGVADYAVRDNWWSITQNGLANAPTYSVMPISNEITSGVALSTLLNASYMKSAIEKNYDKDTTVYGISVDLEEDSDAYVVMNPAEVFKASGSTDVAVSAYEKYADWVSSTSTVTLSQNGINWQYDQLPTDNTYGLVKDNVIENINYVDTHYSVDSAELSTVFDQIYEEIKGKVFNPISSNTSSSTLEGGEGANPLIFVDNIGDYMEVKNIRFISLFGNTYYVDFENGVNVESVDKYGNTIEADSGYAKQYSIASTTDTSIIEGINPTTGETWNINEDIRIILVQNLQNGVPDGTQNLYIYINQEILPILLDEVEVTVDADGTISSVLDVFTYSPLRVFYTVGMTSDILDANGNVDLSKVDAEYIQSHTGSDGKVYFYSNEYGQMNEAATDGTVQNGDAHVGFVASGENRYYYHQANYPIYDSVTTPEGQSLSSSDLEEGEWGVRYIEDGNVVTDYNLSQLSYSEMLSANLSSDAFTLVTFYHPDVTTSDVTNDSTEVTYLAYSTLGELKPSFVFGYVKSDGTVSYLNYKDGAIEEGTVGTYIEESDIEAYISAVGAYIDANGLSVDTVYAYLSVGSKRVTRLNNMTVSKIVTDENGNVIANNNKTETAVNSYAPSYNEQAGHEEEDVHEGSTIVVWLGNNGRVAVEPATGIELEKVVEGTISDVSEFGFTIAVDVAITESAIAIVDTVTGNAVEFSVSNNVITLALAANQKVRITGIPEGAEATITEAEGSTYTLTKINDVAANGNSITLEVPQVGAADPFVDAKFTNVPNGDLTVVKDVLHNLSSAPAELSNKVFTFEINVGTALAGKRFAVNRTNATLVTEDTVTVKAEGIIEVQLKDNESVTIIDLPVGTEYTVTETNHPDGFVQTTPTTGGASGTIEANGDHDAHFVNTYTTKPVTVDATVSGTKTVVGDNFNTSEELTFKVQKWNATTSQYEDVTDTTNEAYGTAKVTVSGSAKEQDYSISLSGKFTEVGEYYYRVIEVAGSVPGMEYDATYGRFRVVVTDDGLDGQLDAVVEYYDETTSTWTEAVENKVTKNFTNTYTTTSASTTIPVKKTLTNETGVGITLDTFQFQITQVNSATDLSAVTGGHTDTAYTSAGGEHTFQIHGLNAEGTYYYVVSEVEGELKDKGMTYDGSQYLVTVTVTNNNSVMEATRTIQKINADGTLATETTVASFANSYDLGSVAIPLGGTKVFEGNTNVERTFTFELYETDSSFIIANDAEPIDTATVTTTISDTYAFSFKNEALSKTKVGLYYYSIKEVTGILGGVTYDTTHYHVTVPVIAEEGKLVVDTENIQVNKIGTNDGEEGKVVFVNTYTTEPVSYAIKGTKELIGRTLKAGEFTFELYENETKLESVTNGYNKNFEFSEIEYSSAGQYTYKVVEVDKKDTVDSGVTYSQEVYTVVVTVKDNGAGELVIDTVEYTVKEPGKDATSAEAIVFKNTYVADSTDITISGKKILEGAELQAGDFEFALYETDYDFVVDSEAKLVNDATVTNDAEGNFSVKVEYKTTGTHFYVLKEVVGEVEKMVYDSTEYHFRVVVVDNTEGELVATLERHGANLGDITFTNIAYDEETNKDVFDSDDSNTSIDGKQVDEGKELTYVITYTNYTGAVADVIIGDKIPECTTYVEDSATIKDPATGEVTYHENAEELVWLIEDVAPLQTIEVSFKVTVDTGENIIKNQAHINDGSNTYYTNEVVNHTYEDNDPVKDVFAADDPTVSIDGEGVKLDDILTYTIDYTNVSDQDVTITVTDVIPECTTYVDGSADNGGQYSEGTLTWTVDVPAWETVTVSFQVKVVGIKGTVVNQATVIEGTNGPEIKTNSVENEIVPTPVISIEKTQAVNVKAGETVDATDKKLKVEAGDVVTYYLTVKNAKDAATVYNLEITDAIPTGLELQYIDGEPVISGGGEVDSDGVIIWTVDKLAANEEVTLSFNVIVPAVEKETTWTNVAYVVYDDPDNPGKTPTESNEVVIEEGTPKLVISKYQRVNLGSASDKKLNAKAGDKVVYSIVVTNNGTEAAKGVTISDKIPAGLTLVENAISEGGKVANGVITWTIDEVAVGQSIVVHFAVTVPAVEKDTEYKNIATVVYDNNYEGPDVPQDSNEVTFTNEKAAPQTGDSSSTVMWTSLAFGSLMVCAVLLINNKKRNEEA